MAIGQAVTDIANVEIEKLQDNMPELLKDERTLVGLIADNGRSQRIGTGSTAGAFRVVLKTQRPGAYEFGSLDGGALPQGKGSAYDKLYITPYTRFLPVGFTKLAELVGTKVDNLAVTNVVQDTMADAAVQAKMIRNQLLNAGDGTAKLGLTLSATGTVITMQNSSFGARLIYPGQKVTIWSGSTLWGQVTVGNVFNQLGMVQSFSFTGFVGFNGKLVGDLNASGLIVRPKGLTDGAPVATHGLPYFNNTSTAGTYFGLTRANAPYVIAPGYDAGGGQITLPVLDLLIQEVKSKLGVEGLRGQSWHTHSSQVSSYKELLYERQYVKVGEAPAGLDMLYTGKMKVADFPVLEDTDADQVCWDFVQPKAIGQVMYGDGPFWYEIPGIGRLYPLYDTSGSPLTEFGSTFCDANDFYCDNPLAGGRISNLKVPSGHAV